MNLDSIKGKLTDITYTYYASLSQDELDRQICALMENHRNMEMSILPTTTLTSTAFGIIGEDYVESVIKYPVKSVSRQPQSADLRVTSPHGKIAIEVKNYSYPVPKKEVAKFARDMKSMENIVIGGIFISLNTPIWGINGILEFRGLWTHEPIQVYVTTKDPDLINHLISVVDEYADRRTRSNFDRSKMMNLMEEISGYNHDIAVSLRLISETKNSVMHMFDKLYEKISATEGNIRNAIVRSGYILAGKDTAQKNRMVRLTLNDVLREINVGSFYSDKLRKIVEYISDVNLQVVDKIGKYYLFHDIIQYKVKFMNSCMDVSFYYPGNIVLPKCATLKDEWVTIRVTPLFPMDTIYLLIDQLLPR